LLAQVEYVKFNMEDKIKLVLNTTLTQDELNMQMMISLIQIKQQIKLIEDVLHEMYPKYLLIEETVNDLVNNLMPYDEMTLQ